MQPETKERLERVGDRLEDIGRRIGNAERRLRRIEKRKEAGLPVARETDRRAEIRAEAAALSEELKPYTSS